MKKEGKQRTGTENSDDRVFQVQLKEDEGAALQDMGGQIAYGSLEAVSKQ